MISYRELLCVCLVRILRDVLAARPRRRRQRSRLGGKRLRNHRENLVKHRTLILLLVDHEYVVNADL